MVQEIKNNAKKSMEKSLESLTRDLTRVRTGKAQITMLDSVRVSYYGNLTPLSQVAALSCPDARSFLIAPWEVSLLKEIESAIVKSDLGMTPMSDGKVIRLKLPDLTEDRRRDLAKQIKKMAEDARIAVRMSRRDANELLKQKLKDKQVSEDENKRVHDEIQKMTDEFIVRIDKISAEKEKDVMTV